MKKLMNLVLFVLLIVSLLVVAAGCGKVEVVPQVTETQAPVTQATEPEPVLKAETVEDMTAGEVAALFVESLATRDFEKAISLTEATGENSFVFGEDIEWYLPRSSFSGIQKLGFSLFKSKVEFEENNGVAECVVTLYDASESSESPAEKSFTVKCVLNDDNYWVVSVPEFYCSDFQFRAAGGDTSVYIDGKAVSNDLCFDDSSGPQELCKDYIIPFIGKNDVQIELRNENYTYTQTVTPNSNNNITSSVSVLKPVEEPEKCFSYIKDTWNALCAKYLVGEIASCVQDYISDDASYDLCNIVWDGFEAIHIGDSSQGGIKNENYNLTVCKASNKGGTYWLTDKHVMCYFDYELTWYYNLGKSNQSTHQNSSVVLCMENGVYKFYAFPDTGLFMEANNYSNEW